ncbi:hypothetical protein SNE40_000266 [Patella caerulea]|uniref:Uncharacterized protein n=1 Tax=Patella caerulea TaxID=87958 RepID=A0AAN8KDG9_PATCE
MKAPRRKITRLLKIIAAIFILCIIIFFLRGAFFQKKNVLEYFYSTFQVGDFELDCSTGIYTLTNKGDKYLSVSLPIDVQKTPHPTCNPSDLKDKHKLCLEWDNIGKLEVIEAIHDDTVRCYNIVWTSKTPKFSPFDCFSLPGDHWYGGSALKSQQWPLEEVSIKLQPYVSATLMGDYETIGAFGPMIERYWINSHGVGLFVDNSVPLQVSINHGEEKYLCLKSDYTNSNVYPNPENNPPVLKYTVCKAPDVMQVHKYLFKKSFDLPLDMPDADIMRYPKWSTFSRFRQNVSQSRVLTLVNNIKKYKFPISQLDIEEGYERGIGDFHFNDKLFRNSHQMIGEFKEAKYKVITSVNPFVDNNSVSFAEAGSHKYFMKGDNQQLFNFSFRNKTVSLVDFTNPEALKWFKTKLDALKTEYLMDSFKFIFGEASFISTATHSSTILHNPCEFTTKYVELAHTFGKQVIVTAAHQTQKYPVYVEIGARSSTWSSVDGLPSLIPTVLTYGILGYPFVIPGPIGGFPQSINETTGIPLLPDRELYIRWLAMSAYLPVMQFSVAPWQYDEEVVKIAQDFVRIHETKVLPVLLLAAKESLSYGYPLIRPVWWIAPEDSTALRIDCEFLVADVLLVAPILDSDSTQRDIYLPQGSEWEDQLRGKHYKGGQWLTGYDVKLHEIPTFFRLKSPI